MKFITLKKHGKKTVFPISQKISKNKPSTHPISLNKTQILQNKKVEQIPIKLLDLDKSKINSIAKKYTKSEVEKMSNIFNHNIIDPDKTLTEMHLDKKLDKARKHFINSDFEKADKLFLQTIKNDISFEEFKARELAIQAFNLAYENQVKKSTKLYRYTHFDELDSYLKPDPRIGGSWHSMDSNSDYKSVTLAHDPNTTNSVRIGFPTKDMLKNSRIIKYTQFPRKDIGTSTTKDSTNLHEMEVQIHKNTKVPVGNLEIKFLHKMSKAKEKHLLKKYEKLGKIIFAK